MTKSIFSEIAREVGVSSRTVQRILNEDRSLQRPSIVARAERIRELAAAMNYRPNAAAKAVSTGVFASIGLLLSEHHWTSYLPQAALRGMLHTLTAHDISLTTTILRDGDLESGQVAPRMLREWAVDGLIVNYQFCLPPVIEATLLAQPQAAIWFNSRRSHDCVAYDEVASARTLTQYLLELGHRRIAYLDASWHASQHAGLFHYSREDRLYGYREVMIEAGLTPEFTLPLGGIEDLDAMRTLLRREDRPTAIVTYGGEQQLLAELAWSCGLRLPQDLVIGSFTNAAMSLHQVAMVADWFALGKCVAETVLARIAAPHEPLKPILLPRQLAPLPSRG